MYRKVIVRQNVFCDEKWLTFKFSGDIIYSRDIALQDANYENAALSYIKGYDCKELYLMMYGDREFDFIAVHICTVFYF